MIDKTGIFTIPAEEYHSDPCATPSLSSSVAWTLVTRSPLHAWFQHPRLNPDYEPEESTAFDIGSAAHALLLEGEDRMVPIAADSYRTKAAQEARDEARAAGKHPILIADYDSIIRMRSIAVDAIAGCDEIGNVKLGDGVAEATVIAVLDGIALRCRPDWLANDRTVMLDYKTTSDAEPGAFNRQIGRMGYHFQGAFYRRVLREATGQDIPFVLVAQETKAPHAVSFHACAPSLAAIADAMVDEAIATWTKCVKANKWPGYINRIHYAEATSWQMTEHEERLSGIPYDPAKLWEKQA